MRYIKLLIVICMASLTLAFITSSRQFGSLDYFWCYFSYPLVFLLPIKIITADNWCKIKNVEYVLYFLTCSILNQLHAWLWGMPVDVYQYIGDVSVLAGMTMIGYAFKSKGYQFNWF